MSAVERLIYDYNNGNINLSNNSYYIPNNYLTSNNHGCISSNNNNMYSSNTNNTVETFNLDNYPNKQTR
jgi:hypothetical protein